MPHCILEYSSNVLDEPDVRGLLLELHRALSEGGEFALADIKSRVVRHDRFLVGDGAEDRAFVALDIQVLSGRSDDLKARIADRAADVLHRAFPKTLAGRRCSVTVQVSELHRPSYRRHVSGIS